MNGDFPAIARGSQGAGSPPPIPAKTTAISSINEVRTSLGNSHKQAVPKKPLPATPPPPVKAAPQQTAEIIQAVTLPVLSIAQPTPAIFANSLSDHANQQVPTVSKVATLRMGERDSQQTPGNSPSKERKPLPPPPTASRSSHGVAAAMVASESLAERSKKERAHKQAIAAVKEKYGPLISEAEEQKNPRLLIERLRNLGQEMLKLHEWSLAAVYLNAALAVCKRHPDEGLKQSIVINMAEIEQEILEKEEPPTKKAAVDVPDRYFERRDQLNDLRKEIEKKSHARHPPKDILEGFSHKIDGLLKDILKDIYEEIGAPPCEFTLLGLGSYARKEMSPYSDLEFVILVKEKNPETLAYFRKLVKLLEIQVIHLGETKIDILEKGRKSPVKAGFSFDSGGNTPLAKQRELIMTPEELGYYQTDAGYDEDAILSIVLRTVGVAVGSHDLYNRYMDVKREVLSRPSVIAPGKKIREQRALLFLRENLNEFAPKLDQHKKQEPRFDIKAELYRLLNFSIMGISEYYGIEAVNSWDKLKALLDKGILCFDGVENLKTALNATMAMRIRCQLHHKEENDKAYHPALISKRLTAAVNVDEEFILSPEDIETIAKVFSILKPLQAAIERVCETGDFSHLAKETFYQGNFALMGDNNVQEKKFDAAKACFERAIAVDPDNPELQLKLAELLIEQGAFEEARPFASEAFSLGTKRQHKPTIARSAHALGKLEITHCKRRSAVDYLMKALQLYKELKGSEHADVAAVHHDLGRAWMCEHFSCEAIKRKFDPTRDEWVKSLHGHVYKALDFYNQALDFYMRRGGQSQPVVATLISQIAEASLYIPTWSDTLPLSLIEMAFKIGQVVYDKTDPRWREIVYRQGCIYAALGKPREEFEEKYRTAWVGQATWMGHDTPFGKNNPYLALFTLAQGDVVFTHASDGSIITKPLKIRVRQWYGEALKMNQQIYPPNHPLIAANMRLLAIADKKNVAELEKALTMIKQIYGKEHPKVIFYLNTLAKVYTKLKKKEKAATCTTEAKKIASSPAYIQETKDYDYVPDNIEMANQRVKANQRAAEVLTEAIRPFNNDDASRIANLAVLRASNHPIKGPIPVDPKTRMNLTLEIVDKYLKPIFRENQQLTRIDLSPFANSGDLDMDAVISLLKESTHIVEVIIDGSTFTGVALGQYRSKIEALASNKRAIQVTFIGKEKAILTEQEILERYRQEAEAGDKVGQYNLGIYHEYGKAGLLKSEAKAAEFYMKSAEQGYASAQNKIGCFFRDKLGGFPQSDQKAAEWFFKAAEQGNANAQNRLGYMHEMGLGGLAKSAEKALEYYDKAAQQGNQIAQENCARLKNKKDGNAQSSGDADYVEKLQADAESGNAEAQYQLGLLYRYGRKGVQKSDENAAAWFLKAAKQHHVFAYTQMGAMYAAGLGALPKSEIKARECYEEAARRGCPASQYNLGFYYQKGLGGLVKSDEKAVEWYRKSAEQGDHDAQYKMGIMYRDGCGGLPESEASAKHWFELSARQGNKLAKEGLKDKQTKEKEVIENAEQLRRKAEAGDPDAQNDLGVCFRKGTGVPQSDVEAAKWYAKSAVQGNKFAQNNLGVMYENGLGNLERSEVKARELYEKAAKQGNQSAIDNLERLNKRDPAKQSDAALREEWQRKAEAGDAEAHYQLGVFHDNGKGGLQISETKALECYMKAAEKGHAVAQSTVGLSYDNGLRGLQKSDSDAVKWYLKAAEQGNAAALNNLGIKYANGLGGLPKSSDKAFECYLKAADKGSCVAMRNVAEYYSNGWGGAPKSMEKAVEWYTNAAEKGDLPAQNSLGFIFETGEGGWPISEEKAVQWYLKAAEGGLAIAQRNLGLCFMAGFGGLPRSDIQAVDWFRKGAAQGDPDALYQLGVMYEQGLGVPKSLERAKEWYEKAAEQGDTTAQERLQDLNKNVSDKSKQTLKDTERSSELQRKAEQGDAQAQFELGILYVRGEGGLQKSDSKAFEWYMKAAEQGHAAAQFRVGMMYDKGQGVKKSDTEAVKWYKKAAAQGQRDALTNLGVMYDQGLGVPKSKVDALRCFMDAANKGCNVAQRNVAFYSQNGWGGLAKSIDKAIEWNTKAADQGDLKALYNLGELFEERKSMEKAIEWYTKAAELGYADAQYKLGEIFEGRKAFGNARQLYEKAAAQGNAEAKKKLARLKT